MNFKRGHRLTVGSPGPVDTACCGARCFFHLHAWSRSKKTGLALAAKGAHLDTTPSAGIIIRVLHEQGAGGLGIQHDDRLSAVESETVGVSTSAAVAVADDSQGQLQGEQLSVARIGASLSMPGARNIKII